MRAAQPVVEVLQADCRRRRVHRNTVDVDLILQLGANRLGVPDGNRIPDEQHSQQATPRRGDVVFRPPQRHVVKNAGASELRSVRIDFLTSGAPHAPAWGTAGLSPNYKLLFENQYARAYDIRIPAGTSEPRHTHKDRVVVCLSGAELEHILPDGRKEVSTLKTGEVAWRRGGTHIGHNLG